MGTKPELSPRFSGGRRRLLKLAPVALFAGCDISPSGRTESMLRKVQRFNDWVQEMVFDPGTSAPEYPDGEATPEEGFRVNSYDTDRPDVDPDLWTLEVDGLVKRPGTYALADITRHDKRLMNTRHCCVEGWSMVPRWGGFRLRDFLSAAGADPGARFLAVECGDGYYTSYDMPSALHPQTLLCTEAYGKPLELEHGAPVRIVMPTKLGYKSAKWVTKLTVVNERPGGYWEDQGYDWFAGL